MNMATLHEVRENFRGIAKRVKSQLPEIINDSKFEIIELNKSQLSYGIDSKGNKLEPEYRNPYYSKKKFSMNSNAGFGTPDLKFTGRFYYGFDVVVGYRHFEVDSSNSKTASLVKKYGKFIFGLTQQNKKIYATETLHEEIRGYIRLITGI